MHPAPQPHSTFSLPQAAAGLSVGVLAMVQTSACQSQSKRPSRLRTGVRFRECGLVGTARGTWLQGTQPQPTAPFAPVPTEPLWEAVRSPCWQRPPTCCLQQVVAQSVLHSLRLQRAQHLSGASGEIRVRNSGGLTPVSGIRSDMC